MKKTTTQRINTSADPTTEYAAAVVDGEVVAGPHVRDACRRHLDDLQNGPKRGLRWDPAAAERYFGFCRDVLRLSEGQFEGIPFELHPSQKFKGGSLFGWKWDETDKRRFRRAYIEEGKGNGKSPFAGSVGLYGLAADSEFGAEIYAAGATKEQASVLFRDAVKMVDKSPALSRKITPSGGPGREYNLAYLKTNSFFRPVSKETKKTGSGPRPHFALCDEVHEHPDGGVIEILERGFKFRQQPLLLMITNSGSDRQSICWQEREHAVAVASGKVEDDTTFSYVCAMDEGDEPFDDPSCWEKANPLLGVTITEDYLALQVKQARDIASKANGIRRLHFCQWTDAAEGWITGDLWNPARCELNLAEYEGRECYGGLDMSLSSDLTALVLAFPGEGKRLDVFSWFWMPGDRLMALQDRDNMGTKYQMWRDEGYLITPRQKVIDYAQVASFLVEMCERFRVKSIAYDRNKVEYLNIELDKLGAKVPLRAHPQGFFRSTENKLWLPTSVSETEVALTDGALRVHPNPVLDWCVSSATCQESNIQPTDRYLSKRKSTGRIDGAVALVMAIGNARDMGEKPKSYTATHGVMVI